MSATLIRCHPIDHWDGTRRTTHDRSPYAAGPDRIRTDLAFELEHLGASSAQIGLDLRRDEIRQDGWPRAQAAAPPAVVLTFEAEGVGPLRFQMDRFDHWWDNLRAIGLTLTRLRLVEQTGVARSGEQYRGWAAIGSGDPVPLGSGAPGRPTMDRATAAQLLSDHAIESPLSGRSVVTVEDLLSPLPEKSSWALRYAYRLAARRLHPDTGADPDHALFARVTEARDALAPTS